MAMKRGDLVETWFDTGAFGGVILYGVVVAAGPKRYTVVWESGLRNRLDQDHSYVKPARDVETAREAMARRQGDIKF
jgi:hypothetical protein